MNCINWVTKAKHAVYLPLIIMTDTREDEESSHFLFYANGANGINEK